MKFLDLPLDPCLIQAVNDLGFSDATPVQEQAIPLMLQGKDLMVGARTGTGKTAAFMLPILQRLITQDGDAPSGPRALVLVPTRELAQQVFESSKAYARYTQLSTSIAYGGVEIGPQIKALKKGADVLVATPGRLLDLVYKNALDLRHLDYLVFDEADRMLDMGFKDEISAILKKLPKARQTLLFSATLDDSIFRFSKRILNKPSLIEVDQRNTTAVDIEQIVYNCDPDRKLALVSHIIKNSDWQQVLIFSRTKQGADQLAGQLNQNDISTEAIHGDRSQSAREKALAEFKEGLVRVLVATDVAARGIDIEQLACVINFDMPYKAEDYIHRIGRTGRAGNKGHAISLLIEEENYLLEEIEVLLDSRLPQQWLQGFEPDLTREIQSTPKNSKSAQKRRAKARAFGKRKRR